MIKLKNILVEETIDEKFSVQGMRAREIISTILIDINKCQQRKGKRRRKEHNHQRLRQKQWQ